MKYLGSNPSSYYGAYELKTNKVANDFSKLIQFIDSTFASFDLEVDVEDLEELNNIMLKVRSKKITTSCVRLINEK